MSRSHEIRKCRRLAPGVRGLVVRFGVSCLARIFLTCIADLLLWQKNESGFGYTRKKSCRILARFTVCSPGCRTPGFVG